MIIEIIYKLLLSINFIYIIYNYYFLIYKGEFRKKNLIFFQINFNLLDTILLNFLDNLSMVLNDELNFLHFTSLDLFSTIKLSRNSPISLFQQFSPKI